MKPSESVELSILNRIYGKGRGWAFSQKDFSLTTHTGNIDRALSRMAAKGRIRRVMRGLYDYPAYSQLLKKELSPDINQVAHALARKFGWTIQVSGNAALNIIGLSTQVPTQYIYLSDGPSKQYQIGTITIAFKKTRFTQLGLKHKANEILVQAVQALGDRPLTAEEQHKIKRYIAKAVGNTTLTEAGKLDEALIKRVLKDTQYVTSWIARNIQQALLSNDVSSTNT